MAARIDIDKEKEGIRGLKLSRSGLNKMSVDIAMGILDDNPDNYKKACAKNPKLQAIDELLNEMK